MKSLLTAAAVAAALSAAGCNRESKPLGAPVPPGTERATVQAIAQGAERFSGKTVVIEGLVAGGCSDGDGIVLADGTWRVEVTAAPAAGFQIPVRKGARVRTWGVVAVKKEEGEHPEARERDDAKEPHAAGREQPEVVLAARGVEWL